jgi:hypothetical protein
VNYVAFLFFIFHFHFSEFLIPISYFSPLPRFSFFASLLALTLALPLALESSQPQQQQKQAATDTGISQHRQINPDS